MLKTLLGLGLFFGCGFAGVESFKSAEYQKAAGFGLISLGGGALVLPRKGKTRKQVVGGTEIRVADYTVVDRK